MPRTDVHAPKNLRPEDYAYLACGNHATSDVDAYSPSHLINAMVELGYHFDDVHGAHHCSHCGSFLIYYAIMCHTPTKTMLHVGETCLDNRFSMANADFQELRKAAKLNRERKRLAEKRDAWLMESNHSELFYWAKDQPLMDRSGYEETFEAKFVRYVERYGEASDKFVAAIQRSKIRSEEWAAKKAEEAKTAKPVVEGRIKLTGEIVSTKVVHNGYDSVLKMLVKDDRGFKVWGTCPASIEEARYARRRADLDRPEGKPSIYDANNFVERVEFVATVMASDDDPTFGFFKRPSGGELR